jgi:2-aminoethylphosphonate-pyruvate transaminase
MSKSEPLLLTPGPLTTSSTTKQAMLRDWGSRDPRFIEMFASVRQQLIGLVDGQGSHDCVCMQGSGTFMVEATIGTLVPPAGKLLVLINGAYGHRMMKIAGRVGRDAVSLEWAEDEPVDADQLRDQLIGDSAITHVAVVHCETTSGILNPIERVAEVVAAQGRRLIIDAMSAFGALGVSAKKVQFDAVVASTNKCLEGAPGMGFGLLSLRALEESEGNAHSLVLDLYDQWRYTARTGQWRFTPPTHVIAAFHKALDEHRLEGGIEGRGGRYLQNCEILLNRMSALGFESYLSRELQAPIIVTFHTPADPAFAFTQLYDYLAERGYLIYPGKLTKVDSFRIGCIGRLSGNDMHAALDTIEAALVAMGVSDCSPGR